MSTLSADPAMRQAWFDDNREPRLLNIEKLTVDYSTTAGSFTAINEASLFINAGEIVGLLGESGSGKTTLALSVLRCLSEAATVAGGQIFFRGNDLLELKEKDLRKIRGAEISVIYQDSSALNPVMQVGRQVSEVFNAHFSCDPRNFKERVRPLFLALGLEDFDRIYHAYPHQLSGGQRQRIAIAQALICEPSLVIADEPTSFLDPRNAALILAFIKSMRERHGTAFLIISHDPDLLAPVADRIIVLYAGQIVEAGPAYSVFSNPQHPYTRALLECSPQRVPAARGDREEKKIFPFIPGNSPGPFDAGRGCAFSPRCPDRLPACESRRPELLERSAASSVRCFKYED